MGRRVANVRRLADNARLTAQRRFADMPPPEIREARMSQAAEPDSTPPQLPPTRESLSQRFELPMLKRYPVIAGALAGLLLRLAFSGPAGSPWSAMAGWFIYLAPVVVGMVTVYLAERACRRSWVYYAVAPMMATALFVVGSLGRRGTSGGVDLDCGNGRPDIESLRQRLPAWRNTLQGP